jgi:hypothetical protein
MAPADPRLQPACRLFHGSFARAGAAMDAAQAAEPALTTRTVEDVIARRQRPAAAHMYHSAAWATDARDGLNATGDRLEYGGWMRSSLGPPVFYVEVPKTSSSTVKGARLLTDGGERISARTRSFALVRHPVSRALSAFLEVVKKTTYCVAHVDRDRGRARLVPSWVWTASHACGDGHTPRDPPRCKQALLLFLRFLHANGDLPIFDAHPAQRGPGCFSHAYRHALSQMWFLSLYPQPIQLVGRLEDVANFSRRVRAELGVALDQAYTQAHGAAPHKIKNAKPLLPSSREELLSGEPLELAQRYYAQDMACLGYT